jgi:hypothetical protein
MRGRRSRVLAGALSLCIQSCATPPRIGVGYRDQQHGSPALAALEEVPVKGSRAEVFLESGTSVKGELLAADGNVIYLRTHRSDTARLSLSSVHHVVLQLYPSADEEAEGLGILGGLSTLTHGVYLLFTAPFWIITTAVASNTLSETSRGVIEPRAFSDLYAYARFPQGLPPAWPEGNAPQPTAPPGAPAQPVPTPTPTPGSSATPPATPSPPSVAPEAPPRPPAPPTPAPAAPITG